MMVGVVALFPWRKSLAWSLFLICLLLYLTTLRFIFLLVDFQLLWFYNLTTFLDFRIFVSFLYCEKRSLTPIQRVVQCDLDIRAMSLYVCVDYKIFTVVVWLKLFCFRSWTIKLVVCGTLSLHRL